jgi:hypothetical protein
MRSLFSATPVSCLLVSSLFVTAPAAQAAGCGGAAACLPTMSLHAAVSASVGALSVSVQDSYADFQKQIADAAKVSDYKAVGRVLKKEDAWAAQYVAEVAMRMGTNGNEETAKLLKALKAGWKEAFSNDAYVVDAEKYYGLMPQNQKRSYTDAMSEYRVTSNEFFKVRDDKDAKNRVATLKSLAERMAVIGESFESINAHYRASECFNIAQDAVSERWLGKEEADVAAQTRYLAKLVENREKAKLDDSRLKLAKSSLKHFESLGLDGSAKAGTPAVPYKLGTPAVVSAEYEPFEEIEKIQRPSYGIDEAYASWNQIWMQKPGTKTTFASFEKGLSPEVIRSGVAEIALKGSDGEERKYTLSGRVTYVETVIGEQQRPWGFLIQVGQAQDFFQGFPTSLEPDAANLGLYVAPAASAVMELDGETVRVLDDNMDGVYGSMPKGWGYVGMTKGEFQYDLDSVLIGKRPRKAVPFSEVMQVGKNWYKFTPQETGKAFSVVPLEEVKTGEVSLKFKGPDPSWVVIKGKDGLENCFYDLTQSRKVEVPAGRYELYCGGLRAGKGKDSLQKAYMAPPKKGLDLQVQADGETELELGAPFSFDAAFSASKNKVIVQGESLTVVGVAGERYHRLWNVRAQPEVAAKSAKGKGSRGRKMQLIEDQNTLTEEGFEKAWKALNLEIEGSFEDGAFIQLLEKKNKMFGKIESDWIGDE